MSLIDDLKELLAKFSAEEADVKNADSGGAPLPGAADEEPENESLETRLLELINGLEDKVMADRLLALLKATPADKSQDKPVAGGQSDDKPDAPAQDEEAEPGKADKPAMDARASSRTAGPKRSAAPAMDAAAVSAQIRAGLKAQLEAARDVRPLIGDIDPLAFDSAAQIYGRALRLIGKPSRLTDPAALRELCLLARDTRQQDRAYPVLSSLLAADAKGESDPNFAGLGNIRRG